MAEYKKMYVTLFNALTDAIRILQRAQQEAEEIYILTDYDDDDAENNS